MRMKKRVWGGAFVLLISAGIGHGCGAFLGAPAPPATPKREPAPVRVAKAELRAMPSELAAIGQVEALATVEIRPQVGGEIVAVSFQEGDLVQEGQPLFQIDPRPYENALKMAEAKLGMARAGLAAAHARVSERRAEADNADTELKRDQSLLNGEMVTREEFDRSRTRAQAARAAMGAEQASTTSAGNDIESAQAEIDRAKLDLAYCDLRAPITGRTGSLLVHKGDLARVNDATAMVTIVQTKPIYVAFTLPEKHLAAVRARLGGDGLPIAIQIPTQEDTPVLGKVSFIENTVDTRTSTIRLKATLPNEDERLWPGQYVQVHAQMSIQENAVVVPSQSIQNGQNGAYVYVVKADLSAELRPVKPGPAKDGYTALLEGLAEGETVVRDGQLRVAPGATVAILQDGTAETPAQ